MESRALAARLNLRSLRIDDAVLAALDGLCHTLRARIPDNAAAQPVDQPIVLGNPTRIRTDLGWTARIPLEKTLDDLLAFWRAASA